MEFTTAFAVFTCVVAAQASTVDNVLTDIAMLNTNVTNLNNLVVAFPNTGGTLAAALGPVFTAFNTATNDTVVSNLSGNVSNVHLISNNQSIKNIIPVPISITDGISILDSVESLEPVIINVLTNFVIKKPAFAGLPINVIPLFKSDLENLRDAAQAFEAALIAKEPDSLQASATSISNAINSAFATAIAAYN